MKRILFLSLLSIGLTGCASMTDYSLYAQTQQMIAQERAKSEIARYNALKEIAKNGDSAAQVAAVITLNQQQSNSIHQQVSAPTNLHDTVLKWASIVIPSAVQVYGIGKNADIAINNSNNSKEVSINNNESMVNMGRLISGQEAPVIGNSNTRLIFPEPTNIE